MKPAVQGSMQKQLSNGLPGINTSATSTRQFSPQQMTPLTPKSPSTESKSTMLSDLFSDDLFGNSRKPSLSPQATSPFTSPRISGSPDLQPSELGPEADPEEMAKHDPLATQVWKMYAKTKANLPHAQRMENITWRMMALALKKKKEEEELAVAQAKDRPNEAANKASSNEAEGSQTESSLSRKAEADGGDERGRRIDKRKGSVRVVGFDGTNQDGVDEPEFVRCL